MNLCHTFIPSSLVAMFCATSIRADVVFSSFGPDRSYSHTIFYQLQTATPQPQAMFQFQPNESGQVTSVSAAAFSSGASRTGVIEIYASNNDTVGGLLWSMNVVFLNGFNFPQPEVYLVANGPVLSADQEYFFTVRRTGFGSLSWWTTPESSPVTTLEAHRVGNAPWSYIENAVIAAFEVSIPTPGSAGAMLCFGVMSLRRSRRR